MRSMISAQTPRCFFTLAAIAFCSTSAAGADDSNNPEFVYIPAAKFMMGSETGDEDETPVHEVRFTSPYEIMAHEVTRGAFKEFVDATDHKIDGPCRYYTAEGPTDDPDRHFMRPGFEQDDHHPVVCVSAFDAISFAKWKTETTGRVHRLPSEAEWEFAARTAENNGKYPWRDTDEACERANISDLDRADAHHDGLHYFASPNMYATFEEHTLPCRDGYVFTAPVGEFLPNSRGIYDMIGNAWEWVADCAAGGINATPEYTNAVSNGAAIMEPDCNRHGIRGSSWHTGPKYSHVTNRSSVPSKNRIYHLGFRLVRDAESSIQ